MSKTAQFFLKCVYRHSWGSHIFLRFLLRRLIIVFPFKWGKGSIGPPSAGQAEICTLLVNSGHLWLTSHSDIREYWYLFHRDVWTRKCWGNLWNLVAIINTKFVSWEIRISIALLTNGSHLWFTSHSDVKGYSLSNHRVAGPRNGV